MSDQLERAAKKVEARIGYKIPDPIKQEVLSYATRKCECIGKPASYLPLLYETELDDYFTRLEINMRGVANNVQSLFAVTMRSPVSECT